MYASLQGVGRAMDILELLSRQPRRPKDVAAELDLKWTTAYRTITHLEDQGYLERNAATGEYFIGGRLYMIGTAYLTRHDLALAAPSHLRSAADAMKCAAQANERQAEQVITVAAVEPTTAIPMTSAAFSFPLAIAAKGQVLLAFAPEDVQEAVLGRPIPRFTEQTLSDPAALRRRLALIRADGFAVTKEDIQPGVGSVAAPVHQSNGAVIGCVSLVVRSNRMEATGFTETLVHAAQDAAGGISLSLGWQPKPVGHLESPAENMTAA